MFWLEAARRALWIFPFYLFIPDLFCCFFHPLGFSDCLWRRPRSIRIRKKEKKMDRILLLSALILFTAASVIFAAPTQQRCKYFFLNYIKILFWIYKSHISLMWNILMIPAHQEMECIWLTVCLDVSFLFSSLNEQLANVNLPIILMGWPTVGESNGGILLFVMGEGNDRFRRVCLTCGIAQQNGNNEALCCGLSVLCTKALSPFANALCAPCRRNFFDWFSSKRKRTPTIEQKWRKI